MKQKIKQLQNLSAGLEPASVERAEMLALSAAYAERFLQELPEMDTYVPDEGNSKLLEQAFADTGEELGS